MKLASHKNALGQYSSLGSEVFFTEFGSDWTSYRSSRQRRRVDFSGPQWSLETLVGEPEHGLMHKQFIREHIEVLNLAKNKLTDISCVNAMKDPRTFEFRRLQILNASRNMLTFVKLVNPSIIEINLSHNELVKLPDFSSLHQLSKLLISHNCIDDTLEQFGDLQKLRVLDLSFNKFSWRPTTFRKQLSHLEPLHLEEMRLWPNPFAEGFKEYQFITATTLSSITSLDGFKIDSDLRFQLRVQADQLHMNSADFSIFDVRVEERRKRNTPTEVVGAEQDVTGSVPCVNELIECMRRALDEPDNLLRHIYSLEQKISYIWAASFWDRRRLMLVIEEGGRANFMKATEERQAVAEFADKMQQVLGRFESVQDVLIMCLVRMLACGNRHLAVRCGKLLAEWVDATAEELHDRIDSMSEALFRDLRSQLVLGVQSVNEPPMVCYEISQGTRGKQGDDPENDTELEQIESSWYILTALNFGPSTLYDRVVSPWRARVLRPFLPVLCRESRALLGEDQPLDRWAEYQGFDSFPDDVAEVVEAEMNLLSFQERCVRQAFGGFVIEPGDEGMVKVYFKHAAAQNLVSMRRVSESRTLHTRPIGRVKRPQASEMGDGKNYSWNAWVDGLAVLVTATSDPTNAAHCVTFFDAHKPVMKHESDNQGFTEAALLGSSEAKCAFLRLLKLGRNLMRASGEAGIKASQYFLEHKLHTHCWARARRRLQEGGAPMPVPRLSEMAADDIALIAELVGVLNTMMDCGSKEICDQAMTEIKAENGLDVFDMLLEVAAYTSNPDPFLLSIAYETIYVFLKSDVVEGLLVKVIVKLRETAILLPYIRGPHVKGVPNDKYMQLWCKCELKYSLNTSRERLQQLYDSQDPDEQGQWREMVPEIRELQNPMMHRAILGIVKLIQLFSEMAQGEETSATLKPVTDLLDASGRERLLIGPTTGLVTCPDFDVRVESLKCVRHVLEATPEQFDLEEMGWLLNYLTSVGMGIGKQGLFLMEVIELIKMFVRNQSLTGQSFRSKFAKYAIRESFEMLTVNSRRETHGNEEEARAKAALTEKITQLLMDCSRPLSGGLRKFLRRVDLLETVWQVLQQEERGSDNPSVRVLLTWTGRDVRQVLLPIITSPAFLVHGTVVHCALVRLADVMQGKTDCKRPNIFEELPPTDESQPWPGLGQLFRSNAECRDAVEAEDTGDQHDYFVNCRGMDPLLDFAYRFFAANEEMNLQVTRTQEAIAEDLDQKERSLRLKWETSEQQSDATKEGLRKAEEEATMSEVVEESMTARLKSLNDLAGVFFKRNLNHYDEQKGEFSLAKLAKVYQSYWKDNENRMLVEVQERKDALMELMRMPDKIYVDQQLKDLQDQEKLSKKQRHLRQPQRDLDKLMYQAKEAHTILKLMLCDAAHRDDPEVSRWCQNEAPHDAPANVLSKGLVDFLKENQALAIDAGILPSTELKDLDNYKYFGQTERRTNLSVIYVEFPTVSKLLAALQEFLKRAQRLFLWQVRNRFRVPTNLGEYFMALKFQLQLRDQSLHFSELRLCLSGKSRKNNTIYMLRETTKRAQDILNHSCSVPLLQTSLVAQFLTNLLRSRSIRHQDTVFLRCRDVNLEVDAEDVFAQSAELSSCQLFVLEREAGPGVVKAGDMIRLKSFFTHKYLDVHASGHLRCRLSSPDENYDMTFMVEIVGCRDNYAMSRVGMSGKLKEYRGVHVETALKLKVKRNCITVRGGANFLTSFGEKLSVKSEPEDPAAQQIFTIYRDGALVLDFHSAHSTGRKPVRTLALETSDEILRKTMMEAHMRTEISALHLHQSASFRTAPSAFRTMMWSIAGTFRDAEMRGKSPQEVSLHKLWMIGCKNVAAILRCAYMLLEMCQATGGRRYILEAFSGRMSAQSLLPRIVTMVSALQTLGKRFHGKVDVSCALLPKKFMKMCTSAIQTLPLCQSPDDIEITLAPREQDRRERELATLDRDRMSTMGLIGSYACKMVVHPMLGLLQVAGQRPLAKEEVLVCKEFALLTTSLVQSLFDNEMRCVSSSNSQGHGHGHRTHAALTDGKADAKADAKDKPGEKENGTEAVVAQGGATESQVAEVKEVSKSKSNALSEAARAEVVEEVIPAINIKALVHLLLYAMHQESIAFRHGSRAEIPVRHMSTMVNCSIASLASLMSLTGTSHSKKLPTEAGADQGRSCDYDVCEALSQAMTEGSQLVPKARLAQLQAERSVDALRPVVQQMIEDGSFDTDRKLYRTERVSTIAYVWLRDSAEKEKRRLLVTTTRFRLAVLEPSDASLPGRSELCLSRGVRDMRDIHRGVFHRRMRQLMLLLWEEGAVEGNSTEAMIFDSSQRQRWFVQALRRVPRGRKESEETTRPRKNAMGIILRSTGILEVTLNPAPLGSLLETCQVRRGGIPLVGVAFVEGQDSDLELLVLTRCSLTVVPFHSFWGKLRQGDAGYYEKDESIIQLSMETDSEDDRLPPFKENLVAATNDTEEKCEARQGPFDIEELQGVWFLSEAVPKVRLQFNSMLEVTFTSDGERQRFRRQLAFILAEESHSPRGKKPQAWTVVPTDQQDLKAIQKSAQPKAKAADRPRLALA